MKFTLKFTEFHFSSLIIALLLLSLPYQHAQHSSLDCNFERSDYRAIGRVYECQVNNDPQITTTPALITSASGSHDYEGMTISNVSGVSMKAKTVHYFPGGLDRVFNADLTLILISECGLKEIHRDDLKPFTKLKNLDFGKNSLEVIEFGLFKFNKELEVFIAIGNRIKFVSPGAFDGIVNLRYLSINQSKAGCVQEKAASDDKAQLLLLIKKMEEQCFDKVAILKLYHQLEAKSDKIEEENLKIPQNSIEVSTESSQSENLHESCHELRIKYMNEAKVLKRDNTILRIASISSLLIIITSIAGFIIHKIQRKNVQGVDNSGFKRTSSLKDSDTNFELINI